MKRREFLLGAGALTLAVGTGAYASYRQMGSMSDYDDAVKAMRSNLIAVPETSALIGCAALAASGHNTQPWSFHVEPGSIRILPDYARRTPVVDPDDHHLFVSLGCAAENLAIAAEAAGRPGEVSYNGTGSGSVAFIFGNATPGAAWLHDAIGQRQSTRTEYDGKPVGADDLKLLAAAGAVPGVTMVLLTERAMIGRVRDLVIAGNTAQMRDPAFLRELKFWLRFSPREAIRSGDGLFSTSSGNPAMPTWLGSHLFDWAFNETAENDKYARHLNSSAGVAVFIADVPDHEHWISAGRACQRFALQATVLGIKTAFVNQPVEAVGLRPELASLVGLPDRRPDLVIRFGYGAALPYSARRPVQAILKA